MPLSEGDDSNMYHRRAGAKGLVFGGLMAALVAVFAIVPGLGIFMPIPLVLAYVRFGGRTAALTGIVALLLSVMFSDPVSTFIYLVPGGILPGLAFGYGFRHKMKPLLIGIIAVVVFFVGYAGTYVVSRLALTNGRDPIAVMAESKEFHQMSDPMWNAMENYYKTAPGIADAQRQQMADQLNEFRTHPVEVMWTLLPSMLFMWGAFSSWLNYMLCKWILPRFGHDIPTPTPFAEFRLPAWLTWVFMVLMYVQGFVATPSLLNAAWWVKVIMNVFQPLGLIFVLCGMAVAFGWLRKRNIAKPLALGVSILGLFIFGWNWGMQIYLMLAVLDTVFDFRGLGHGWMKRPETE